MHDEHEQDDEESEPLRPRIVVCVAVPPKLASSSASEGGLLG
jgi:hypothetical protein